MDLREAIFMELESTRFGIITLDEAEVIRFKKGLYAFEDEKEFVILEEDDSPFFYLHAVNNPDLCFVVTEPGNFYEDYEFKLGKKAKNDLQLESPDDVLVINLVVIPDDYKKMTINLKAPIVINQREQLGRQIIIDEPDYPVRQEIFSAEKSQSAS